MAGSVDRPQPEVADLDDVLVADHEVVRRQHLGVLGRDADVDPGLAAGLDGLDVVEVAVGREDPADAERPAERHEQLVLVGRVDEDRLARAPAPHDVGVVLVRSDDDLVDPHGRRLVVGRAHWPFDERLRAGVDRAVIR